MKLTVRRTLVLLAFCALLLPAGYAHAQGVTTGSITGVVLDAQKAPVPGASVVAVHEPSGTRYEATTRADGRFSLPGMRVGGPYSVTASLTGFQPQTVKDVIVSLGVASDLELALGQAAVTEEVTVTAQTSEVFSSARTGAATAVSREVHPEPPHRPRPHQRLRPTEPAVLGGPVRRLVRRPGQPAQQHHGRRLLLQQLLRPGRPARRPDGRHADLDGRRRGDPDQRRALRRPAGPLRRRRRQHGHPQWNELLGGLGLLLDARQRPRRHRGQGQHLQPRHVRRQPVRRVAGRPDPQGQALLLRAATRTTSTRRRGRRSARTRAGRRWAATSRASSPPTSTP